jgi:hypothetical protein
MKSRTFINIVPVLLFSDGCYAEVEVKMTDYIQQYQRVRRYLIRIQDQDRDRTEYEDDLWSFFQNCWHLKDWLINDDDPSISPELRDTLEHKLSDILSSSPNLRICADLANRKKHVKLKNPWADATARGDIKLDFTEEATPLRLEYLISVNDDSEHSALDVAKQATEEWHQILADHRLATE